jgi:glycosyltransferase involved in cell wall biosynthesis
VIIHDGFRQYPKYFETFPAILKKYVIGYAVWELSIVPPEYQKHLQLLDEVWTSSTYCKDIFAQYVDNVHIIPHVVDRPRSDPKADELMRGLVGQAKADFCFYSVTRFEERKNIFAAIQAYRDAFPKNGPPFFVKTHGPVPSLLKSVPGISFFTGRWNDDQIAALHRVGKCFVSPHCSEGWGLCISDAMSYGNLAIGTSFSGSLEFMNKENSLLVPFSLNAIQWPNEWLRFGFAQATPQAKWANINVKALAQTMTEAFVRWHEQGDKRQQAARDMTKFSRGKVARTMLKRLASM